MIIIVHMWGNLHLKNHKNSVKHIAYGMGM